MKTPLMTTIMFQWQQRQRHSQQQLQSPGIILLPLFPTMRQWWWQRTTAIIWDLCAAAVSNEVTIMTTEPATTAITWDLFVATICNDMMSTAMTEPSIMARHLRSLRCCHFQRHDNGNGKASDNGDHLDLLRCCCFQWCNNDDDSYRQWQSSGIFALLPFSNKATITTTEPATTVITWDLFHCCHFQQHDNNDNRAIDNGDHLQSLRCRRFQ